MPSFCNYPGNLAAQLVIFVNYIDFGEDHSCDANPENREQFQVSTPLVLSLGG